MKFSRKSPRRLTLKGWAAMEDLKRKIDAEAKEGNWSPVPDLIFQIIELSFKKLDKNLNWMEVIQIFEQIIELNSPRKKFPLLLSKEKNEPMPWEYEGRSWYFWLNLFSNTYGWSSAEVEALDIDDAIALYQEIIIDDQLNREWQWGLSEISYEYNKTTKQSHFKPLPRPDWMRGMVGKSKKPKEMKVPKTAMPVGEIINLDEKQG